MKKKKVRIRPFRILSVCLGLVALIMLSRFPAKAVSLERQQEQLKLAAQANPLSKLDFAKENE